MKFDPGRACVMHRHTGPTKTFVLEGEHHVFEPAGAGQFHHVARKAGTWATSDGDNVHYESGHPLEDDRVTRAIESAKKKLGASGRLVIRPSGTESVIRVMAEGDDERLVSTVVGDIVEAVKLAAA